MQAPSTLPQAAHPAMRNLRRAQAAIAALASGPFGTEAVTIVQAIGRVLAVQPGAAPHDAPVRRPGDAALPLSVGTVLSPAHTALLASMRSSTINVFARARVGVACMGGANDCRTTEAMLSGLVNRLGAKALSTRCPSPEADQLPRTVEMLLVGCDLVLLCGALDDAAWHALVAALGASSVDTSAFRVPQLDPVRIARHAGKLVVQFGDDPGPAFATFVLLLSPLIRRLQGRDDPIPLSLQLAVPNDAHPAAGPGESIVLTRALGDGGCDVFPVHGAGDSRRQTGGADDTLLFALARASGLAWLAPQASAGDRAACCFPFACWLA
jgi:molybdopterin molybdotransferase